MEENGDFIKFLESLKSSGDQMTSSDDDERLINCEICGKKIKNDPGIIKRHIVYCKNKQQVSETPPYSSNAITLHDPKINQTESKTEFTDNLDLAIIVIGTGILVVGLFFIGILNPRRDTQATAGINTTSKTTTQATVMPQEAMQSTQASITPLVPPKPFYAV